MLDVIEVDILRQCGSATFHSCRRFPITESTTTLQGENWSIASFLLLDMTVLLPIDVGLLSVFLR
jgi:hypothetical protein